MAASIKKFDPLLVRVEALLSDILQSMKMAESPDTIVSPAVDEDLPKYELELRTKGLIVNDMLPP